MPRRRPVKVLAVEKLTCTCGPQECGHCGHRASTSCADRLNHCPCCGSPFSDSLNGSASTLELVDGDMESTGVTEWKPDELRRLEKRKGLVR
jgi:hypothetical protein